MRRVWLILLVVTGCGPPAIHDCDGLKVAHPAMAAPIDGGWIAIDTSGSTVRAVLELEVQALEQGFQQLEQLNLELQIGTALPIVPSRYREGQRVCFPSYSNRLRCDHEQADPETCVRGTTQPEERCYQTLRAEYFLTELPQIGDTFVLNVFGTGGIRLTWR
jgi:hypothetical protein